VNVMTAEDPVEYNLDGVNQVPINEGVGLTFAANYAVFGNHPLGYGVTNLALAIACGGLLYLVARELWLPSGAAILAVALWLLNPHGMNTAILWMSVPEGRFAPINTPIGSEPANATMQLLHQTCRSRIDRLNAAAVIGGSAGKCGAQQRFNASTSSSMSSVRQKR